MPSVISYLWISLQFPKESNVHFLCHSLTQYYSLGQVLKHENLGSYLTSKVPKLKELIGKKTNGNLNSSSIRVLANVMQTLERCDCHLYWCCINLPDVTLSYMGQTDTNASPPPPPNSWKTCESSLSQTYFYRIEFKGNHGEWIDSVKPDLDPALMEQLNEKLEISDTTVENFKSVRNETRMAIISLLKVIFMKVL